MHDVEGGRWESHSAERDGVRWQVEVDGSLRARAPLAHLAALTRVCVEVRGDGDALLAADEAAALDAAVAALGEALARPRGLLARLFWKPNEARYVGRRTRRGACELVFYSARPVTTDQMGALVRRLPRGQANVEETPDPGWSFYLGQLHPGPTRAR